MKNRAAKQKIAVMLLTFLLSVTFIMPVCAVRTVDLDRDDGTIRLEMVFYGTGEEHPMSGGEMSLYLVGPAAAGDTGYFFDTEKGRFAGTEEAEVILGLDSEGLAEQNAVLSLNLSGYIHDIDADQVAVIEDGEAEFTSLKAGLYLIVMTKEDDTGATITPFMMSLPDADDNYDIYARPKPEIEPHAPESPDGGLPQTGQLWWPVPVLVSAGLLLIAVGYLLRRHSDDLRYE